MKYFIVRKNIADICGICQKNTFLNLYRAISGIFNHNYRKCKLKKRKENISGKYGSKILGPGNVSYAANKVELDFYYPKFSIGANARVTEGSETILNSCYSIRCNEALFFTILMPSFKIILAAKLISKNFSPET